MIVWEIKKLIKSKGMIISLAVLSFTLLIISFTKPALETENYYIDEQKGYVEDNRDKLEITGEKFEIKLSTLEEISKQNTNDEFSKTISSMSKEKLDNLKINQYKNIEFWQVFNYRATNPLINIAMLVIIMIIISNLYTDEIISSVKDIILSSKEKKKTLNSKIIISFLIPIVIYSIYLSGTFIITYIQQGTPINGDLEAFRIVNNISILRGNPTIIDYITKPFSPKEVAFRVKAHLRRANYTNEVPNNNNINKEKPIKFGPYLLNESSAELIKGEKIINLTAKELKILSLLVHNPNQIISKEKLCDRIWGEDYFGFDNTIMVHIRKLREKIEEDSSNPKYIVTVRGLGYKLSVKED